ncbi:hypothetical protein STEG23_026626 [Scotinomys teguina]
MSGTVLRSVLRPCRAVSYCAVPPVPCRACCTVAVPYTAPLRHCTVSACAVLAPCRAALRCVIWYCTASVSVSVVLYQSGRVSTAYCTVCTVLRRPYCVSTAPYCTYSVLYCAVSVSNVLCRCHTVLRCVSTVSLSVLYCVMSYCAVLCSTVLCHCSCAVLCCARPPAVPCCPQLYRAAYHVLCQAVRVHCIGQPPVSRAVCALYRVSQVSVPYCVGRTVLRSCCTLLVLRSLYCVSQAAVPCCTVPYCVRPSLRTALRLSYRIAISTVRTVPCNCLAVLCCTAPYCTGTVYHRLRTCTVSCVSTVCQCCVIIVLLRQYCVLRRVTVQLLYGISCTVSRATACTASGRTAPWSVHCTVVWYCTVCSAISLVSVRPRRTVLCCRVSTASLRAAVLCRVSQCRTVPCCSSIVLAPCRTAPVSRVTVSRTVYMHWVSVSGRTGTVP